MPLLKVEIDGVSKDKDGNDIRLSPRVVLRRYGPTIPIRVGPAVVPGKPVGAEAHDKIVYALIDTGATNSCIDNDLAAELKLRIIDCAEVGGVAGRGLHDVFMGKLIVDALGTAFNGRLIGVKLGAEQPIIVGRDFLSNTLMIYDGGSGTVTLAR